MATVRHAQQRVGIADGETVVVLGQGATGLLHTKLAKLAGAHRVIGVSRSPWKLELAQRFGADHVVGGDEDAAAAVGRLTGGSILIPSDHVVCPEALRELERAGEHTSELQSLAYIVCRLLLEKKKNTS